MLAATEQLQKQSEQDAEDYITAQKHLHAITAGLSSNDDGQAATLNDQLLSKYFFFFFFFFNLHCNYTTLKKTQCSLLAKGLFL